MDNASLASQAMTPPLKVEMVWTGRDFKDFGRKMFSLQPLSRQEVYFTDSTLGPYKRWGGKGLWMYYPDLVRKAFKEEWWARGRPHRMDTPRWKPTSDCTGPGVADVSVNTGVR